MRKLLKWLGLALVVQTCALPAPAFAEAPDNCTPGMNCKAKSFAATAPSGKLAFTFNTGARVCFDGASNCASRYLYSDGTQFIFNGGSPVAGSFRATAASGANAFQVNTNGARIDFGSGASDYASSDGTTVSFAGPILTTGLTVDTGNMTLNGSSASIANETLAYPVRINDANGLNLVGVATASLSPCAAVPSTTEVGPGTVQFDTDTKSMKLCNGTAWVPFANGSNVNKASGSASVDLASIANGACAADFTVTVVGPALTDGATCTVSGAVGAASNLNAGFLAWATPADSNVARVRVCNFSGAAVDLAVTTVYVNCVQ